MAQTSEMMEQLNAYMASFFKEHGSEEAAWAWETESNQIKVKKALLVKASFFFSKAMQTSWKKRKRVQAYSYWCKQHLPELSRTTGLKGKKLSTALETSWKALGEKEQAEWKETAKLDFL